MQWQYFGVWASGSGCPAGPGWESLYVRRHKPSCPPRAARSRFLALTAASAAGVLGAVGSRLIVTRLFRGVLDVWVFGVTGTRSARVLFRARVISCSFLSVEGVQGMS